MSFLQEVLLLFFITPVTIFFSSCDPGSKIRYEVVNKSTKPINLKFELPLDEKARTYPQEVSIPKLGNKIITEKIGLGNIDYFEKEQDSIYIYELVIAQDNKRTNANFKNKKYWKFKKNGNYEGVYQLFFDTGLFEITSPSPILSPKK